MWLKMKKMHMEYFELLFQPYPLDHQFLSISCLKYILKSTPLLLT